MPVDWLGWAWAVETPNVLRLCCKPTSRLEERKQKFLAQVKSAASSLDSPADDHENPLSEAKRTCASERLRVWRWRGWQPTASGEYTVGVIFTCTCSGKRGVRTTNQAFVFVCRRKFRWGAHCTQNSVFHNRARPEADTQTNDTTETQDRIAGEVPVSVVEGSMGGSSCAHL